MSKALQAQLKPGDQIIATEDAFYDNGEASQRAGDIIMVNNTRVGSDIVSGTGLNGTAYNGRPSIGLGGSLKVGTFRRATPDDPGFMATREQWGAIKDAEIISLKSSLHSLQITLLAVMTLSLIAIFYLVHA